MINLRYYAGWIYSRVLHELRGRTELPGGGGKQVAKQEALLTVQLNTYLGGAYILEF